MFVKGDSRTYEDGTDAQLRTESQRLRDEIVKPKLSFSELAGVVSYNSIVIGATLAPLAFAGFAALVAKSPATRKTLGLLEEKTAEDLARLRNASSTKECAAQALTILKENKSPAAAAL